MSEFFQLASRSTWQGTGLANTLFDFLGLWPYVGQNVLSTAKGFQEDMFKARCCIFLLSVSILCNPRAPQKSLQVGWEK